LPFDSEMQATPVFFAEREALDGATRRNS